MRERLKELRKKLGLTQQEFADRLGIKRNAITNYEVGRNDPADMVVSMICREFNVNEEWLRTGKGTMLQEPDSFSLDDFVKRRGASDIELAILKAYFDIDLDTRRKILNRFRSCFVDNKDPSGKPEESGE